MPTYGLKYQSQFKSLSDENNVEKLRTLQFLFKDYTGAAGSVMAGDSPAVQRCTVDDPFAPIKGQSMDITLVNKNQSLSLLNFYSDDDDGVMVKLLDENNNVLFIGFVVQDDCYEEMVDYTHYLRLSVTDSLGLLKGVILSEASVRRGYLTDFQTNGVDTVVYVAVNDTAFYPTAGDVLELNGVSYIIASAVQENTTIGIVVYRWTITLTTTTGGIAHTLGTIYLTGEVNLIQRNSLLTLIAVCLAQTQLPLLLNIFHNVFEYRMDPLTRSMFQYAIIDSQLFINGETYDNCYDVLTKILQTFRCSLFQANGQWNIVHWDELRRYNNLIPGYQYDEAFIFLGPALLNNTFNIGLSPQLTRPIATLNGGIQRGYKFVRKTFNYKYPKYLLRNYDFLKLGALRAEYLGPGGTILYREYEADSWQDSSGTILYVTRFIRVEIDVASQNEIARYLVVKGDSGAAFPNSKSVVSKPIEVNAGDKVKISFNIKGVNNGSGNLEFAMMLTDGTTIRYIDNLPVDNGAWISTIGFTVNFTNESQGINVEITSSPIPFNGLFYVFLTEFYQNGDETIYKDLRFEYIPTVGGSTKVIGQIHKDQRPTTIKNNSDTEIEIDDSQRNPIAGTLFLPEIVDLLQVRTVYWQYKGTFVGYRLGELTSREELWWRSKSRTTVEGGYVGVLQNNIVSLLTPFVFDWDPTKSYVPGLMSIDYKNNRFSCKLYEIWDNTEPEFDSDYSFTYIYSTT